jgi:antitoxin MazE
MLAKLQKWGNSQGLRFSKTILAQAKMGSGDAVDISVRAGEIVVKPVVAVRGKYQLKELLSGMPDNYKPGEVDFGSPRGKEIW